jgi:5'-methylthioadenosine phosphorylase
MKSTIGIIGGSGLYKIEGLTQLREQAVVTPFGRPSGKYILGTLEGREVAFLPRHGAAHTILPSQINHRANIYGFKKLGARWILSASAVGSLKRQYKPLDFVLIDQYYDRTRHSGDDTFFGDGVVAHVSFGHPVCDKVSRTLYEASRGIKGLRVHRGGTYVNMEGPAFSTRAESLTYRKLGFDVIGMTNLYEAKLAREAEICYATMAMVTDYDCWHQTEEHVSVSAILDILHRNADSAKTIIRRAVRALPTEQDCTCGVALQNAILTQKTDIPPKTRKKLSLLIHKYLGT